MRSLILAGWVGAAAGLLAVRRRRAIGALERARDIGIPLDGTPGPLNAITDVPGVTVGHVTIVRGSGKLVVGKGPVRTGVTAVFPRGKANLDPVFAGWFSLNGNGEMTGTAWIDDYGLLVYPDHDHQHQQRRDRARRGDRMGADPPRQRLDLLPAGGGRDLGR